MKLYVRQKLEEGQAAEVAIFGRYDFGWGEGMIVCLPIPIDREQPADTPYKIGMMESGWFFPMWVWHVTYSTETHYESKKHWFTWHPWKTRLWRKPVTARER